MNNQKGMELLGLKATDKVTGFHGVVTSISYDLYGCVQAVLHAPYEKNEKADLPLGHWFDIGRLTVVDFKPVLDIPDFEDVHGPADKPRK